MNLNQPLQQEVWLTVKFKGYTDSSLNLDDAAPKLLAALENYIKEQGNLHGFSVSQAGEVVAIEEEAQIYNN